MKKAVLLMAAGLMAVAANAQTVQMAKEAVKAPNANVNFSTQAQKAEKIHKSQMIAPKRALLQKAEEGMTIAPVASVANGVYYTLPLGIMYQNFGADGYGYYNDIVRYAAYTDVNFTDKSKNPANSQWTLNDNSINELLNEEGNILVWNSPSLEDGYSYPIPYLKNGRVSYHYGETGRMDTQYGYPARVAATSSIQPISWLSDHTSEMAYYGWSSFNDKHYLFGAGSTTNADGEVETFIGTEQKFPAPVSPLYAESIDLSVYTFSAKNAIPAGKELTLEIYIGEELEVPAYTLTATAEDLTYSLEEDGSLSFIDDEDYGNVYRANLHFANKGIDAFGTETEEPFVINDSCRIYIMGFDGVDVGIGSTQNIAPENLEGAGIITDNGKIYHFQSPLNFNITFNGLMDAVVNYGDVEANDGNTYPTWYVEVAADGASYRNGIFGDLDGALFYTGTEWFSEEGDENYTMHYTENFPEWITGIEATVYREPEQGNIADSYIIGFTCEPLPAGVAGRGYFVCIEGRGVVCPDPIFVYQGDAQTAWEEAVATDGIQAVHAEKVAKTSFNLFGQPVNSNFKGFVVVEGQKQIRL